jgi:hypothetical protein
MSANNRNKKDLMNRICPICKQSDQVIDIVYGLPTKEAFEEADEGSLYLGGCIEFGNDPKYYCKRDHFKF